MSGRWKLWHRSIRRAADAADAADAASFQPPEASQPVNVLPRLKESDPFKVLGIPSDSDFEEVQAARNFLIEVWPCLQRHSSCFVVLVKTSDM
jgi:hypothetical protein